LTWRDFFRGFVLRERETKSLPEHIGHWKSLNISIFGAMFDMM
jgi:hypothetical protein